LISVDFPTFDLPITANSGKETGGHSATLVADLRKESEVICISGVILVKAWF
jgi:hypothetical protein